MKQGVKDADEAYKRFFKGLAEYPKFKAKHKSKMSFYVNYESLTRTQNGFHGEKIGHVRTSEPLPKLPKGQKYSNPRISYDGKYWYISVSYEVEEKTEILSDISLGIDVGVKELAVCSNGKRYKNINKSRRVKQLEKKLRRTERSLSRMQLTNIKDYTIDKNGYRHPVWIRPLNECKNFQKQKKVIASIHRKLTNIRNNYLHQTTSEIVKTKPSRIVLEDLNIKGMMKNKHLSKAIQNQKLYEFRKQITYKSQLNGIPVVLADRWYPSSKTCNCCGNIKKDLKLKDRVYKCTECGYIADRDYNASLNLADYKLA